MLQQNERLFLQMLDVEYQAQPVDEEHVLDVFQTVLSSDLSLEFKVKISQRRMEFLEDFGTCIRRLGARVGCSLFSKLGANMDYKAKKPSEERASSRWC